MRVEFRSRGIVTSEKLRQHAVRRIHFALSRFGRAISSVVVRVGDINGPRGGADKRCYVIVRGPALRSLCVEDLSADPYVAIDLAVERAARTAGRALDVARSGRAS